MKVQDPGLFSDYIKLQISDDGKEIHLFPVDTTKIDYDNWFLYGNRDMSIYEELRYRFVLDTLLEQILIHDSVSEQTDSKKPSNIVGAENLTRYTRH